MRTQSLGLEQPERSNRFVEAHDLRHAGVRSLQVLMTRALKADGAPTIASRWLQRMEQLVLGLDPSSERRLENVIAPVPDFSGAGGTDDGSAAK